MYITHEEYKNGVLQGRFYLLKGEDYILPEEDIKWPHRDYTEEDCLSLVRASQAAFSPEVWSDFMNAAYLYLRKTDDGYELCDNISTDEQIDRRILDLVYLWRSRDQRVAAIRDGKKFVIFHNGKHRAYVAQKHNLWIPVYVSSKEDINEA